MRSNQKKSKQAEVSIMTTMAHEATKPSLRLLAKYGLTASNPNELEQKLTELYFSSTNKREIEKYLAENHPHKKFLIQNLDLAPKTITSEEKQIIEEPKVEMAQCHDSNCFIHHPQTAKAMQEKYSHVSGPLDEKNSKLFSSQEISLIALVAIVGITFYALKTAK